MVGRGQLLKLLLGALIFLACTGISSQPVIVPITVTPASGGDPTVGILPSDRDAWNNWKMTGLQSLGGIPNRTTQCGATVNAIGGGADDTANIQAAINACPAGQVVQLGGTTSAPQTFTIPEQSYDWINRGITVRGGGAWATTVEHPTANPPPGLSSYACPASSSYGASFGCSQGGNGPYLFLMSPLARFNSSTLTPCALTADTTVGGYTATVTGSCVSQFHAGDFVLLDERTGAQWMPDTESYNSGQSTGYAIWASPDYRVVYNIHDPTMNNVVPGYDDSSNVSCAYTLTYDSSCDRVENEIKEILGVNGTTVTFDSPTMLNYRVSHLANLTSFSTPFLQQAGLENMTLRYSDSDAIQFYQCAYCWARNLNIGYSGTDIVAIWASFRTDLESNYVHECNWPSPGEACYLIDQKYDSSESLIADNISVLGNKVIVMQASGAGSVVADNYLDKGYILNQCCWQEMGANASHLTGPHHVLFEGNHTFNMDSDATHGSSSLETYYRNWSTAIRDSFQGLQPVGQGSANGYTTWNDAANGCGNTAYSGSPLRAAAMQAHTYWFSFVGNLLGTPGCTTAANNFPLTNHFGGPYNSDGIYLLGWYSAMANINDPISSSIYPATPPTVTCQDPNGCAVPTASCTTYGSNCSTIDTGNFNTVQNTQTWDSRGPITLPNSFYRPTAPSYFSGYTWPAVNPATGAVPTIPAYARYTAASCSTAVFQNNADCEPFVGAPTPTPTITGVTVGGATALSYISGVASGTSLGAVAVTEINGTFGGMIALGGTDAAKFTLSSASLPATLNTNGSTPTCTITTTYNISIVPTQGGVTNSGNAYLLTVSCDPGNDYALASSHLTLSNNNRTATLPTADGNDHRAITSSSYGSGQPYAEWACGAVGPSEGFGIANGVPSLDDWLGHDTNSAGFTVIGNFQFNGSYPSGQWGGCVANDQVGIEFNLSASPKTMAIRVYHAGAWGAFSPSGGLGGIAAGPYYLSGDLKSANGNNTTICTGPATCGIGPVPSGYMWWSPGTGGPTASLLANPTTIAPSGSSTLTWSSTGAGSCTGDANFSTGGATSGSVSVSPATTTTYTVTCGTASANATVTVSTAQTIDDTDASIIYTRQDNGVSNWGTDTTQSSDYNTTEHYSNVTDAGVPAGTVGGASLTINFNGTGIQWIGKRGNNYGIGSYAVDGGAPTTVDAYNSAANVYQQVNANVTGLASGSHSLQVQLTNTKNASSSNYYQVADAFIIQGSPLTPSQGTVAAWNNAAVTYTGSDWQNITSAGDLSGSHTWAGTAGDSISWTFTGSLVEVYGRPDYEDGIFNVFIDGTQVATVDGYFSQTDNDLVNSYDLYTWKGTAGTHTIKLVATGTHNASARGSPTPINLIQFDEFIAFP